MSAYKQQINVIELELFEAEQKAYRLTTASIWQRKVVDELSQLSKRIALLRKLLKVKQTKSNENTKSKMVRMD